MGTKKILYNIIDALFNCPHPFAQAVYKSMFLLYALITQPIKDINSASRQNQSFTIQCFSSLP